MCVMVSYYNPNAVLLRNQMCAFLGILIIHELN